MSEPSPKTDPADAAAPESRPTGVEPERTRPAPVASEVAAGQYLTFRMSDDEFGIDILQVREILEYSPLTPVPLTPPWIRGVLNLRGNVVPVVDLASKFGQPETAITDRTCIVIVEVEVEDDGELSVMGVMADAVSEVVELGRDQLEPPPQFGARVRVDYLRGMGKVDGRLVLLLDANRVLSADELLATLEPTAGEEPGSAPGGPA